MSNSEKIISITEINPVDYYNINHVNDAFDLMLKIKGVKYVGTGALTVITNKGDEKRQMVVIENEMFIVKITNPVFGDEGKTYTPFMLLQKFKFNNSFNQAMAFVHTYLMNNKLPFVRIGTKYFKTITKLDRYGINRTELVYWERTTIAEDYPKSIFEDIDKYDDFTINPDNKAHSPIINNNYNLYCPFEHYPCDENEYDEFSWYWIRTLVEHIFGEQYDLGITYLKVLYDNPKQTLPILVLISEERSTGKTTFVDFLNILFGANMVLINPQDISNQFNGSYADKNIIAIEESRFDSVQATEKLKNLATQKEILVNSKNIRQYSIPFYGKLIITSNDETRFSKVDTSEIRYWVRKVPSLAGKSNHNILKDLKKEIPQFLYYLNTLPDIDFSKSRMVFNTADIITDELKTVKLESRSGLCKDLEMYLDAFALENTKVRTFKFIAKDVKEKFFSRTDKYEINFINKTLKEELKFKKDSMQRYVPFEQNNSTHQVKVSGMPFIFENKHYNLKIDDYDKQASKAVTEGVSYEDAITKTGTNSDEDY